METAASGATPRSNYDQKASEAAQSALAAFREWESSLEEREKDLARKLAEVERERQMALDAAKHARAEAEQDVETKRLQLNKERSEFDEEKRRILADHTSAKDIIGINMGGERVIQVKRSLLIQFEGSFIAAMFSGRWEEQMTRDKDGNVFFDDPPEVMMPLIEWLRETRDATPEEPAEPPRVDPKFHKNFTRMMNRFGLEIDVEDDFKVTDGSHPGTAWFWYRTTAANVVFKYRMKASEGAWINFSRIATREGNWWRSCDWTRGNSSHEVSIWADGECRRTCDGV